MWKVKRQRLCYDTMETLEIKIFAEAFFLWQYKSSNEITKVRAVQSQGLLMISDWKWKVKDKDFLMNGNSRYKKEIC